MNDSNGFLKVRYPDLRPPAHDPARVPAPTKPILAKLPQFLSVHQVAELLGMTNDAVRARIKRREFPEDVAVRLGVRSIRFDLERLIAWLRSRPLYETTSGRR